MDCGVKKCVSGEKDIKTKLVKTRQIIQDKFERAFKARVKREKKSSDKYKPITSTIERVASKFLKPKARVPLSSDDDSASDVSMHSRDSLAKDSNASSASEWTDVENETNDVELPTSINLPQAESTFHPNVDKSNVEPTGKKKPGLAMRMKHFHQKSFLRYLPRSKNKPTSTPHETPLRISKRRRGVDDENSDADEIDDESEYEDENDNLSLHTTGRRRRKLAISDMSRYAKQKRTKTNAKIKGLQTISAFRARVRDKQKSAAKAKRLEMPIEILSDSSDEAAPSAPNPAVKRKLAVSAAPAKNQWIRTEQTSVKRKLHSKMAAGVKPKSTTKQSKVSKDALPAVPFIDNPYLTMEDLVSSAQNPIINTRQLRSMSVDTRRPNTRQLRSMSIDTRKKGAGIKSHFIPYMENIVYEHYDDVNEIVDRLRLLIASRAAGNTNHAQEINSIISELRESGYIV